MHDDDRARAVRVQRTHFFLCLSFPLGFHFQYRSMEAAGKDKVKKAEACLVRNRKPLA